MAPGRVVRHADNPVFRKLRDAGYEVFPVNPTATQVDGAPCFPTLESVPVPLDGVVIATHPKVSRELVRQAALATVPRCRRW